jgi:DNA repair protein RadC
MLNLWTSRMQPLRIGRKIFPIAPWFDPAKEAVVVFVLNTRRRVLGHNLVSLGGLDTSFIHVREVFRPAVVAAGAAIVLAHNHPSGDPTPSEADIKVTRDLIRAGHLLKIELLDHIIIGKATEQRPKAYVSLREQGYFYSS